MAAVVVVEEEWRTCRWRKKLDRPRKLGGLWWLSWIVVVAVVAQDNNE